MYLVNREDHSTLPSSHAFAIYLQQDNDAKRRCHNGGLNTQTLLGPFRRGPLNLIVGDDEATHGSSKVDPRCNFTRRLWVRVQEIAVDRRRRDHDAKDVQSPHDGRDHVVPFSLQREPQEDDPQHHARGRDPDGNETSFRLKSTTMSLGVDFSSEIMKPMTEDLSKDGGDDWSKEVQACKRQLELLQSWRTIATDRSV